MLSDMTVKMSLSVLRSHNIRHLFPEIPVVRHYPGAYDGQAITTVHST